MIVTSFTECIGMMRDLGISEVENYDSFCCVIWI